VSNDNRASKPQKWDHINWECFNPIGYQITPYEVKGCSSVQRMLNEAKKRVAHHELDRIIRECITYGKGTDEKIPGSDVYGSYWWPIVRDAVLDRDRCKCQMCGNTEDLEVHHIKNRQHGGSDHPYNLITLCTHCHDRVHSRIEARITKGQKRLDSWNWEEASHV